jgi:hypothetical protein
LNTNKELSFSIRKPQQVKLELIFLVSYDGLAPTVAESTSQGKKNNKKTKKMLSEIFELLSKKSENAQSQILNVAHCDLQNDCYYRILTSRRNF